jgi:hypothetical protein
MYYYTLFNFKYTGALTCVVNIPEHRAVVAVLCARGAQTQVNPYIFEDVCVCVCRLRVCVCVCA